MSATLRCPAPAAGPPARLPAPARDLEAVARAIGCGRLAVLIQRADRRSPRERGIVFGVAAQATARQVTLMASSARGLVSLAVDEAGVRRLGLRHMRGARRHPDSFAYFLSSVEAARCTGTGISAADRALTIRTAGDPAADAEALISPGHVFPALVSATAGRPLSLVDAAQALVARHTAYDVALWCDVLDDRGELADGAGCLRLAAHVGLPAAQLRS